MLVRTRYGIGGGLVGDSSQIDFHWVGRYDTVRAAICQRFQVREEASETASGGFERRDVLNPKVAEVLEYWDTFQLELLNGWTVFLLQTMLIHALEPGCLSLTIQRQYYSLSFDWWQQLHFANTNYMPIETFTQFSHMLRLGLGLKPEILEEFAGDYNSTLKTPQANHKQLLWFSLKSLIYIPRG